MAVKQLSAIYLAGVAVFGVTIAFARHPDLKVATADTSSWLERIVHDGAAGLNAHVLHPAANFIHREARSLRSSGEPRVEIALEPPQKNAQRHRMALNLAAPDLRPSLIAPEAKFAENQNPAVPAEPSTPRTASTASESKTASIALPKLPKLADVQAKLNVPSSADQTSELPSGDLPPPSYGEVTRVTHHLRESLTGEMLTHFDLFLYVSKANAGPWAQHMYVFAKRHDGDLELLHNWAVSTGREQVEYDPDGAKEPSFTPQGYFELDPKRMYVNHVSGQWHTPMPHAMFFNWVNHGYETGLAIHAATGEDVNLLGTRASAGCVRLAPKDASILFDLVRARYKGRVPKFDFDPRTQTMSKDGMLLRDAQGRVQMAEGYRALVFIEDFGGENVVATLY